MNEKDSIISSKSLINPEDQIKISSIARMQSLPEEVVVKLLQAKGSLIKNKKGRLKIAQKKS